MQRKKTHDVFKKIVDPDDELLLWEEWVKIRNDEVIKLAENLNEPPVDLAMNLLENVREKREWKVVLEHAQIQIKPTLRGHLWEQKLRLHQLCPDTQVYEVTRTAAEKGKPPVIEHICVPKYIQQVEKGLIGKSERIDCQCLDKDFQKYRIKREEDLKEKISQIDPFRPKDCFMVRGQRPKTPPPKPPPLPKIVITDTDKTRDLALCAIYAVRINNTVIIKEIPGQNLTCLQELKKEEWHETCMTWYYYFNNPYKRAGRCKLFLQNLGTVSLRYCWKKQRRSIPFIPEDIYEQVFFFQKNEDVLSPGQSKEIFFTFISDKPGIYCESWELSFCNICFFDTLSDKLCVNLCADAIENAVNIRHKVEILLGRIEKKSVYNIVNCIIDEIFTEATSVQPQHYPYKHLFVEAEMFVMKNPVCFYHQTEVAKMRDMYAEMTGKLEWDLSLGTWRKAMISQDFDDRMKYYDLLKKSHTDLLKPWYEGEDLLKQKYCAMKLILSQMADSFDSKYTELVETTFYKNIKGNSGDGHGNNSPLTVIDPLDQQRLSNLFYIHAYDYVCTAVETCAGVLSSLELNRWIEFDFCQL